jgi:hypothetical protein
VEQCPSQSPALLDQVAAHACRHLAFLARTDDAVAVRWVDIHTCGV